MPSNRHRTCRCSRSKRLDDEAKNREPPWIRERELQIGTGPAARGVQCETRPPVAVQLLVVAERVQDVEYRRQKMYRRSTMKGTIVDLPADAGAGARAQGTGSVPPFAGAQRQQMMLKALWRDRWLVLMSALALAVLIPLASSFMVPRYLAVTEIVIDPSELQIVDKSLRPSAQLTDAMIAQVESQVRVLLSHNVLKRVIEREKLAEDTEFTGEGRSWLGLRVAEIMYDLGLSSTSPDTEADAELAALRSLTMRVGAKRAERTFVVDVSVWTKEPEKSVRLADAVVDSFLEERSLASAEAARRASASLAARLDPLKKRVQIAEEKVETFKRQNNILSAGGQLVDEQQVSAIASQLVLARAKVAEAEAQFDAIRRGGAETGAIPEAVRSATLGSLRTQLAIAVRREAQLAATLMPNHPLMVEARQQVSKARKEVDAEVARIAQAAQSELQRARSGEKSLERSLDTARKELSGTNEKLVRLREIEREARADRQVYEAMLQRTQEVLEQEKIDMGYARVISRAEMPERPSWPPRKLWLVIAGLVGGALVGLGLVLFRELVWRDPSVRKLLAG